MLKDGRLSAGEIADKLGVTAPALTAVVLQLMPDSVPMHYDIEGKIDRWGSKYENLIFQIITLLLSSFWHLFLSYYEKKAAKTSVDKERAEALANAKVIKIVGVSMASMFTIEQGFYLYSSYMEANTGAAYAYVDLGKVSCILGGVLFFILGNFMPKSKKNHMFGVRVSWSMYNDTTWRRSNRFGGVVMMAAGLLTIVTTVFVKTSIAVVMMIVYLLAATVMTLIYSYRVYHAENMHREGK